MRILFCPLASPGFSFPAVPIALELSARGHTVAFATEAWLAPLLRAQGLACMAEGKGEPSGFEASLWHDPRAVARQARALEHALVELRPDVLVTSALALGPLLVGEKAGLPVVVIGLLTELPPAGDAERAEFQVAFDACRAGLDLAPAALARMRGDLYLRRGVPELVDDRHLIGGCTWEPPAPKAVGDWLASARRDGRPIVYVHQARTFGAPGFWPMLAEALPPEVRVAASTSRMDARLRGAPAGSLLGPVVPQAAVLSNAAAVVFSGTTTVALGALEHGIPMVAVPAGGEQFAVAALVEAAGVGTSVPAREATPALLARAFERALRLDPAARSSLRQAFSQIDGPRRAASLIEQIQ